MEPKIKSENYALLGGINTKASPYLTGPFEFLNLSNFDFTTPGSLTKREGSTQYVSGPVSGRITSLYEYEKLSGFSQVIAAANTNLYSVASGSYSSIKSGLLNGGLFDFVTFVDRLFAANGQDFFKYDGTNAYNYGLPPGVGLSAALSGTGSGWTGTYIYEYGYLNERGYVGPCGPGITVSIAGHTLVTLSGFTVPTGFGITALAFYRTDANTTDLFRIGYASAVATTFLDTNLALSTESCNDNLYFTAAPKYLELYNNQMFMAGFSGMLSTVYFSQIGEPEGVEPEFNFEVRTNDGDKVSGMKNYLGSLMVFKENSFHQLLGDDPNNFLIKQVSDQYGCISNRAIVTFEDKCFFLDKKGIVEFNGANIRVVSNKIEPVFLSMNLSAARGNATAIHNRLRNEVWFSIPINGSTINNCTVVYDYVADAFTKFEGSNVSSLAVMSGSFSTPRAFFGDYSGLIHNYGQSLLGDNGAAMTCLLKTRFIHDMGSSVEEQFRRFYIDLDPVLGFTSALAVNFYTNYGVTASLNRTMYQAPFQSRIDFGLPAKSLAAEVVNATNTDPIRIFGFTVESRKQRDV